MAIPPRKPHNAMPAPKTAQGVQVEMRYTFAGQPAENVFHVLVPAEPNIASWLDAVADVFLTWWSTNLVGNFATTIALREVYAVDLSSVSGATYTLTPASPIPGIHPGPSLPNNVALVATKRTAFRGRSFRGRTYFGGIPETVVTDNNASASIVADINADCQSLLDALELNSMFLGVLSKKRDGVWLPEGIITPVQTFALRDARVDSQRGRLPS